MCVCAKNDDMGELDATMQNPASGWPCCMYLALVYVRAGY